MLGLDSEVQGGDGEPGLRSHWQCQELSTLRAQPECEYAAQINSLGTTEQVEVRTSSFRNGDQFAAAIVNSLTYFAFYKHPFGPYDLCFKNSTCCLPSSKIL